MDEFDGLGETDKDEDDEVEDKDEDELSSVPDTRMWIFGNESSLIVILLIDPSSALDDEADGRLFRAPLSYVLSQARSDGSPVISAIGTFNKLVSESEEKLRTDLSFIG